MRSKIGKVCTFYSFRRHLRIFAICLHITLRNFKHYVIRCECYAMSEKRSQQINMQRQRHRHTTNFNLAIFIYFCGFTILSTVFFADGAVHNEFVNAAICCQFDEPLRMFVQIKINRNFSQRFRGRRMFCSFRLVWKQSYKK